MKDVRRFAECLKKAINTKAAYAALDSGPGGTWTAGGCWTLAHAVAGLTGGKLFAVTVWDSPIVQHVVVKVGDKYLDGDGLSTEAELRKRMWENEWLADIMLVPFTPALQRKAAKEDWAVCDTRVATALLPALMKCVRKK